MAVAQNPNGFDEAECENGQYHYSHPWWDTAEEEWLWCEGMEP